MFKWLLGTLAGIILGLVAYFMWYLGALKPVIIAEKQVGPINLIYKEHVGAYHKIVPTIEEVESWAKAKHINCDRTFGEFLDDPRAVEEGRLRANVGCVVSDTSTIPKNLPEDFMATKIPERKYVTAIFEGSPGIGPMKVYPKVEEYFELKKQKVAGPVIEIYLIKSSKEMTTTYLFPMEK